MQNWIHFEYSHFCSLLLEVGGSILEMNQMLIQSVKLSRISLSFTLTPIQSTEMVTVWSVHCTICFIPFTDALSISVSDKNGDGDTLLTKRKTTRSELTINSREWIKARMEGIRMDIQLEWPGNVVENHISQTDRDKKGKTFWNCSNQKCFSSSFSILNIFSLDNF